MFCSEVSKSSVYAVVYELKRREWVVIGAGWAEVHLFSDPDEGVSRIVAWDVSSQEVGLKERLSCVIIPLMGFIWLDVALVQLGDYSWMYICEENGRLSSID